MTGVRKVWQVGFVVGDMDAARAELTDALGCEVPEARERSFGPYKIKVAIAKPGPPYLELIEGEPGSPWDGRTGSRLDHLSYWVDDLAAERDRLLGEGCPLFIDGDALGIPANYHLLPHTNIRVEPLTSEYMVPMRDSWGLPGVEGGSNRRGPWQLGFMVDDIEASRDELTRVLGLQWTPVKSRGGGDLEVCMSLEGPPYYELVKAGPRSKLAWRPSPRFDHLAYWTEDLAAESERLDGVGIPLVQEMREEIRFHHGPRSGLRIELMAGAYRETVRAGWDLDDVG